jgi:hypothetical protein
MARYIMFWEYNLALCPLDPKEKVQQWLALTEGVKKMLQTGEIKEWAHYAGEAAGYCIVEGSELDVLRLADSYVPYVKWTTRTLLTVEQCESARKPL